MCIQAQIRVVALSLHLLAWVGKCAGDRSGFGVCAQASLVAQTLKNLPTMQGTQVRSLGWEDLLEKEMGNGNLLQYSCLENPRDRGACWAVVYGVAQSQTQLMRLSSSSSSSLGL